MIIGYTPTHSFVSHTNITLKSLGFLAGLVGIAVVSWSSQIILPVVTTRHLVGRDNTILVFLRFKVIVITEPKIPSCGSDFRSCLVLWFLSQDVIISPGWERTKNSQQSSHSKCSCWLARDERFFSVTSDRIVSYIKPCVMSYSSAFGYYLCLLWV